MVMIRNYLNIRPYSFDFLHIKHRMDVSGISIYYGIFLYTFQGFGGKTLSPVISGFPGLQPVYIFIPIGSLPALGQRFVITPGNLRRNKIASYRQQSEDHNHYCRPYTLELRHKPIGSQSYKQCRQAIERQKERMSVRHFVTKGKNEIQYSQCQNDIGKRAAGNFPIEYCNTDK